MASNQKGFEVHGRDYGRVERRLIPENNFEASMCFIPGICASPGRVKTCVCDNYAPLRWEV